MIMAKVVLALLMMGSAAAFQPIASPRLNHRTVALSMAGRKLVVQIYVNLSVSRVNHYPDITWSNTGVSAHWSESCSSC